jgi:hypothetical protein
MVPANTAGMVDAAAAYEPVVVRARAPTGGAAGAR